MLTLKLHFLATWREDLTHWKRPLCWENLKVVGRECDNRGWDGWMASLNWWSWVWVGSRFLVMNREAWCAAVPWARKELDTTEWLNWTESSQAGNYPSLYSARTSKKVFYKIYTHLYIHIYIYIYIHIYIHTYTYSYINIWIILLYTWN